MGEVLMSSLPSAAEGVQVGEMFAYKAKDPVTVKRGKAALVPILAERLEGASRVLYYRPELSARPVNAVYLKNSTSLTLEAGPVTFFEGSTCIGEGLSTKVLQKDMHDIIPYAVETGATVEVKRDGQNSPVFRAVVVYGVLTTSCEEVLETTYVVKNDTQRAYTLYLDHAKRGTYTLKEPTKPEEELPDRYRFKVEVPASGKVELKVRERQEVASTVDLSGTADDTLQFYLQQKYMSAVAKKFLQEILSLRAGAAQVAVEIANLEKTRRVRTEDEERYRKNLNVLRDTPDERGMRKEYLEKLKEVERVLEQVRKGLEDAEAKRQEVHAQIAKKIQEFKEE
jgi:hypothetical protein